MTRPIRKGQSPGPLWRAVPAALLVAALASATCADAGPRRTVPLLPFKIIEAGREHPDPVSVLDGGQTAVTLSPALAGLAAGFPVASRADPLSQAAGAQTWGGRKVQQTPAVSSLSSSSGRLPEPSQWALILVGFAMIGAALRGFMVTNRRLARLREEEGAEVPPDPE